RARFLRKCSESSNSKSLYLLFLVDCGVRAKRQLNEIYIASEDNVHKSLNQIPFLAIKCSLKHCQDLISPKVQEHNSKIFINLLLSYKTNIFALYDGEINNYNKNYVDLYISDYSGIRKVDLKHLF
ncbi:MAG: hypothetical protein MHPSP_003743, partial [Paramarteilia canceri]